MLHKAFGALRAIGKAAVDMAGGGVIHFAAEVLPRLAGEVWEQWGASRKEAERRAELEALGALVADQVKNAVRDVVREVAGDRPPEIQLELANYLEQVPASIRRSLRSVPASRKSFLPELSLAGPEDLAAILPDRMPRYKVGYRPMGGVDWELTELLGIGGFGEVWKARNIHFDGVGHVALKFCLDATVKDRLLRHEAAVLNQVMRQGKHPGIVELRQTYLSADPPCLEYEFVPGGDLGSLIDKLHTELAGPPLLTELHFLMRNLASTIAFAHRLSPPVVHRDLKPANILVYEQPGQRLLKITDFGIGSLAADRQLATSQAGGGVPSRFQVSAMRGAHTPLYASPQQIHGARPDPRDDVHALGVLWYQMLTGNLAAGKPSGTRWMQRLADQGLARSLIELLGACVEENPDDRPRDAGELLDQLDHHLTHADPTTALPRPPVIPTPAMNPIPTHRLHQVQEEANRAHLEAKALLASHDYAGAARVLETIPVGLRDAAMLESTRSNAARIAELDEAIRQAVESTQFDGLREQVEELAALQPHRDDLRQLLAALPVSTIAVPIPKDLPREYTNSIGMKFVLIPAGSFPMGSPPSEADRMLDEGPVHRIVISRPFYLGVSPVTQREYLAVLGLNPSHFSRTHGGGPENPVEQVSWNDAVAFCKKLNEFAVERRDRREYRLPTEAEWEYACRGGTATPFFFGVDATTTHANFDGSHPYGTAAPGVNKQKTTKVTTFQSILHPFGLLDLHGNVWEWCLDWYEEQYYARCPQVDPQGPARGERKVVRGGSWNNSGHLCRSARRNKFQPEMKNWNIGFRVVLAVG